MCGIYGITENNREAIADYIKICSHRGPDGNGIWNNDYITLGHNLLAITDDAKNSLQPWKTPAGNILVYNGEIFNYYDLLEHYQDKFIPKTKCDTELLAWGLDIHGYEFVKQMDSMHAFAYYDIKKNHLLISRGYHGIKPLYYAEVREGLIFGSEIKGMLDRVPGSRQVDRLALNCLSLTGINAMRNTFFSNVSKLMPGESRVYDCLSKRFVANYLDHKTPTSNTKFDAEEYRNIFKKSIAMTSIGQKRIGVFLSGGLDSSIIAYELKQLHGHVRTFTNSFMPPVFIGSEDLNSDASTASKLARANAFDHTEIPITPEVILENWNKAIYSMEQPVYNQSQVMYYYTNKFLSENGITVTMAGDMGDELLGGYPKYWNMIQGLDLGELKMDSWSAVIDQWMKRIKNPIRFANNDIDGEEIKTQLMLLYPEELFWNPADPVGSYMALDAITQVPGEFFSRNDSYGMAFSMEGRFPLATKHFAKYAMSIHSKEKINKNNLKLPTKMAYRGRLPDYIINKYKSGWTCPVVQWTKKSPALTDFLAKINSTKDCFSQYVNAIQKEKSRVPALILKSWAQIYNMQM